MHTAIQPSPLGATVRGDLVDFYLWAPRLSSVVLRLFRHDAPPRDYPMLPSGGYWSLTLPASAGDRYQYITGNLALPDPVSRLLPEGVHGPTEIVDPTFPWTDDLWRGVALQNYILYELHVGTFTPEGTLDAALVRLDYLRDLGITAIELMPLNAAPGTRNWGYDGVGLYAVQSNYGGPAALCRFVDAAHYRGLAVVLDVVYNHFGNEGNYLSQFGPYFSSKHKTPWSDGINYDDAGCLHVRRFIVENALYWLREYHLDGLRLDAVQTIKDDSPQHIVAEIASRAHQLGAAERRTIVVTVETDENLPRYVLPAEQGGYAADAVWSDDFHHAIHVLLTGENKGYYQDFADPDRLPEIVSKVLSEPFAFQGEPFRFWQGRPRGASPAGVPLPSQIICIQNHDQVGNRALGERHTALAPPGARKLAAALLLLSPHTPLLFMGQEYDESAPFQFFTDFGDPALQKAVSEGRRREFADFDWTDVPDPQHPTTFERSRLQWSQAAENLDMLAWYRTLLRLRRKYVIPSPRTACAKWSADNLLTVQIPADSPRLQIVASHGAAMPSFDEQWVLELETNQDDYHTRIYIRPQGTQEVR
ncbi:MAG TPA: malto-oligosyltrehalose trehalohydrolase [Candidatus Saccharimonadales bacterium]|nr:malto-oligosyltrehalose trehalohydrolase [Candidatus Saccharimonadales bacterium]